MNKFLLLIVFLIPLNLIAAEDTVIAVIGDFGADSKSEGRVATVLKSKQPHIILTLGDNNYEDGCWNTIDKNVGKYYHEYIGNYKGQYGNGSVVNRFFPTLGNHDWLAKKSCLYQGTLPYFHYFTLPENQSYYDFVEGPIHFFALDSDPHEPDGNTQGLKQYKWLVEKAAQSKAPFKVVYFHHAPYSSGLHGPTKEMRWNFADMGFQLVLSGHDHNYERIECDDMIYLVNGAGGATLYPMRSKNKNSKYFYSKHHGFLLITANNQSLKVQFINDRDHIKDQIIIEK